jgi:hypothetical protein
VDDPKAGLAELFILVADDYDQAGVVQATGLRSIWDAIDPAQRARAESEIAAMADALRDGSGELVEPVTVRFTTATSR